jgi:hypothetical protein
MILRLNFATNNYLISLGIILVAKPTLCETALPDFPVLT